MQDFVAHDWKSLLEASGLDTFESIWGLDIGWFEEPNQCRGGWSGVSTCDISLPHGGKTGLFIKRQQDHTSRTLLHSLSVQPAFSKEFRNLKLLCSSGIPTLEPVYFAMRKVDGCQRAILITAELEGFTSLEACFNIGNSTAGRTGCYGIQSSLPLRGSPGTCTGSAFCGLISASPGWMQRPKRSGGGLLSCRQRNCVNASVHEG